MIVEVCAYRVKAGRRSEFLQHFETRAVPAIRAHGIRVLGPLVDLENPNRFVWLRSFPSQEEYDRMYSALRHSAVWAEDAAIRQMLESWDFARCETSAGYTQDELGACGMDREETRDGNR
jgi:quinol monooxygenase YgiN